MCENTVIDFFIREIDNENDYVMGNALVCLRLLAIRGGVNNAQKDRVIKEMRSVVIFSKRPYVREAVIGLLTLDDWQWFYKNFEKLSFSVKTYLWLNIVASKILQDKFNKLSASEKEKWIIFLKKEVAKIIQWEPRGSERATYFIAVLGVVRVAGDSSFIESLSSYLKDVNVQQSQMKCYWLKKTILALESQ